MNAPERRMGRANGPSENYPQPHSVDSATGEPGAPWSKEAEQSILGALLLDNSALDRARPLEPRHFYHSPHADIFGAIASMIDEGKPADVITVFERLQCEGKAGDCGGILYLNSLAQSVPSAANVGTYAAIVRERATLRLLREASTVADARALLAHEGDHGAPFFAVVDLLEHDEAAQPWVWQGLVPQGHVTLLAGHGGAGKSTLALQIAACVSLGAEVLGHATKQCGVLVVSGEDGAAMMRKRLRHICCRMGLDHTAVATWLAIIDATASPEMFAEARVDGVIRAVESPTFAQLRRYCEKNRPELVIFDTAADFYAASENDRASVRAFMRAIAKLAPTVLLLAHTDKQTARAGKLAGAQSYSGSTAWHNAARSRLFLMRDGDTFELRHEKCNVGRLQPPMRLDWPDDGVIELHGCAGFVAEAEARDDMRAILSLIGEYEARGEFVSTATTSRTHAHALLSRDRAFPKALRPADAFELLRDAERQSLIVREAYRSPIDRKPRERWALTPKGISMIGAATAATAATSVVAAEREVPAQACGDCGDFAEGVIGGETAHNSLQIEGAS